MQQIRNFGDRRQTGSCAYCGGETQSRDHVPSKILLDDPLPANVHAVPACLACNQSFSDDEEYFACLMDCLITGSTNPNTMSREKIKRVLSSKPSLVSRLENARLIDKETTSFSIEEERVRNVILKLARGHALYELNEPQLNEPAILAYAPLLSLSDEATSRFEKINEMGLIPEIGSRAMQRLFVIGKETCLEWIRVQSGRYRYAAFIDRGIVVRMVLSEYLACEVIWV